jgi:MarR family transcriptional regulator, transcriptional regulator for hemolysin
MRCKVADRDNLQFGWLTADTARLFRTVFARRVRELGLTRAQWLALTRVNRRPGVSQSELADMMEIEKAPAGRIVDRLQQKGWIERRAEPNDRRVNRIYLTAQGARVHAAIAPLADATVRDALSGLSAREQSQLVALMGKVKAQLTAMAAHDPKSDFSDFESIDDPDGVEMVLPTRAI